MVLGLDYLGLYLFKKILIWFQKIFCTSDMGNSNIFDKNLLKRKTFVIAGGTSGIGSAVAMQISKLKGNVILIGRNLNKLKSNLTYDELLTLA